MKNYSAKNVSQYITTAPKEARQKLKEMRAVIKEAVPDVEESISWGIPFYKYHGLLAGFASFQDHISFGLVFLLPKDIQDALLKKGYITKKKIIQIRFDQKVPAAIIKRILKTRAKMNKLKSKLL